MDDLRTSLPKHVSRRREASTIYTVSEQLGTHWLLPLQHRCPKLLLIEKLIVARAKEGTVGSAKDAQPASQRRHGIGRGRPCSMNRTH
jgi:hypothetical protein